MKNRILITVLFIVFYCSVIHIKTKYFYLIYFKLSEMDTLKNKSKYTELLLFFIFIEFFKL